MIWRIRDRATFARLAAEGRRVRRGSVTVTFLPGASLDPPQVAYAVGRRVGGAVVRNRVRRRLRAIVYELAESGVDALRPGAAYLIGAGADASNQSFDELKASVATALSAIATPGSREHTT